ncbi:helix-turn-helix domain-containing protein [Nocardioides sp. WS12]|uniref:PucR family transcriptional regulator n=1 Tax=Nocardioides sp. WS12 TaxID=2486272 RepID=UPI0015FA5639|nr:helix-turn-helix domain-containing protein [Nocardioides sp. WS12]
MATLDDLIEDLARLVDAPCTLEDPDFQLIGFSDHRNDDVVDVIRQRSILERRSSTEVRAWFQAQGIADSPGPLRTPADPDLGIAARLCVPARHLGRVHGYFWLIDPDQHIDESTWPEAMRIAEAAAGLLNVAERRQGHRDALFRELVEGGHVAARASAVDFAHAGSLDLREPLSCVLVERPDLLDQIASRPSRAGVVWVRSSPGVAGAVVRAGLVPASADLGGLLTAIGLGRRVDALDRATRVAVGPTVDGIDELARAYRGAEVALRVARSRAPGEVVAWQALGPLALLGVARDDDLSAAVIDQQMQAFLTGAAVDVLETVRIWLDEAGSAGRTATRLSVHRQTVYHRLAQVEKATGSDLSRGQDRLRLHLALQLAPYLGPGP